MRVLLVKIQNMIRRTRVDRPGVKPQLAHLGDDLLADVEVMQPQGLHFVAPAGAQGVLLAPAGVTAVSVALGLQGAVPGGVPAAGEGGLHYLGNWRLYIDAAGALHLGGKDPTDFVALASKVDAQLSQLKSALNAWTPAPNDGGAALKAAIASFASSPTATGSTTIKAQ